MAPGSSRVYAPAESLRGWETAGWASLFPGGGGGGPAGIYTRMQQTGERFDARAHPDAACSRVEWHQWSSSLPCPDTIATNFLFDHLPKAGSFFEFFEFFCDLHLLWFYDKNEMFNDRFVMRKYSPVKRTTTPDFLKWVCFITGRNYMIKIKNTFIPF